MAASILRFLDSLFLRAGSVVLGPVGLGMLLWPPGTQQPLMDLGWVGRGWGAVPLLGLPTPTVKSKSCHHTRIISARGTLLICKREKERAYIEWNFTPVSL